MILYRGGLKGVQNMERDDEEDGLTDSETDIRENDKPGLFERLQLVVADEACKSPRAVELVAVPARVGTEVVHKLS